MPVSGGGGAPAPCDVTSHLAFVNLSLGHTELCQDSEGRGEFPATTMGVGWGHAGVLCVPGEVLWCLKLNVCTRVWYARLDHGLLWLRESMEAATTVSSSCCP